MSFDSRKYHFYMIFGDNSYGIYKKGGGANIHDTPFHELEFEPYREVIYSV